MELKDLNTVYDLMQDELSRTIFLNRVLYSIMGDYQYYLQKMEALKLLAMEK